MLDEPFSGLDPVGVDVLSGVLAEYAARRRAGGVLLAPARARRAPLRGGGDHQGRPARGVAAGSRSCATAAPTRAARARQGRATTATGAGSAACRAPRSSRATRAACWWRSRDGVAPDAVLDAARAAGSVTLLQPRAADAGRPVPRGGGGMKGARTRSRSSLAREIRERVREKSFLVSTGINVVIIVARGRAVGGLRRRRRRATTSATSTRPGSPSSRALRRG